jgi:hypothetical protein
MFRELAWLVWGARWPALALLLFSTGQPQAGLWVLAKAASALLLTVLLAHLCRVVRLGLAERHGQVPAAWAWSIR